MDIPMDTSGPIVPWYSATIVKNAKVYGTRLETLKSVSPECQTNLAVSFASCSPDMYDTRYWSTPISSPELVVGADHEILMLECVASDCMLSTNPGGLTKPEILYKGVNVIHWMKFYKYGNKI